MSHNEDPSSLYQQVNNSWSLANNKSFTGNTRPKNAAKIVTVTYGMILHEKWDSKICKIKTLPKDLFYVLFKSSGVRFLRWKLIYYFPAGYFDFIFILFF